MSLASLLGRVLGTADSHAPAHITRRWATNWLTVRAVLRAGATDEQIAGIVRGLDEE